ncbi:MAG TPA: VOC family protein [Solirubrobacteraceae bacterium]|jgi:methylmalonyl-CoA/ethylmalonyl-CoA epimerase|nr:VOC family protein [Solirubrobacteraceae bacterium]
MTVWRRLDHVAMVVTDTETALAHFSGELGMRVVETEELEIPPVRLTYLDAGAVTLQLVEPLAGNDALEEHLAEHGEGLHHVCFEVDDLEAGIRALSGGEPPALVIHGRDRVSAFVPGPMVHGLRLELTQVTEGGSP